MSCPPRMGRDTWRECSGVSLVAVESVFEDG